MLKWLIGNCPNPPTERFLLLQRLFTFLDEWGAYLFLAYLFSCSNPSPEEYRTAFYAVCCIAGSMIGISYIKQWWMERQRFNNRNLPD